MPGTTLDFYTATYTKGNAYMTDFSPLRGPEKRLFVRDMLQTAALVGTASLLGAGILIGAGASYHHRTGENPIEYFVGTMSNVFGFAEQPPPVPSITPVPEQGGGPVQMQ